MGTFQQRIELAAGPDGPFETLDALVGTRAMYTLVPSSVLQRLGVEPTERRRFITPGGSGVERDVGWATVRIDEEYATTLVVFGEGDDEPVLGSFTLTGCGLGVDPLRQRLIPVPAYLPGFQVVPDEQREAV